MNKRLNSCIYDDMSSSSASTPSSMISDRTYNRTYASNRYLNNIAAQDLLTACVSFININYERNKKYKPKPYFKNRT